MPVTKMDLTRQATNTGSVSLNSQKITNLLDPTTGQDAATKAYVDATAAGIDWKGSVRLATTANGTLASSFANASVIDGVTLATGDRLLIKDQTTGTENGLYVVQAAGAPVRSIDADTNGEVTAGMAVFVEDGTVNADTGWVMTNNGAITLGTTSLVFTQFTGIGSLNAGAGLVKTGNVVDAVGTANRIVVNANDIDIGSDVVTLLGTQSLSNKTLVTPTVASFINAGHNHTNAAGGGQITDAALSTAVTVSKGGTGATTANAGLNALLPSQATNSGKVLQTNGTDASWVTPATAPLIVTRETPTGLVNGSNTTYTLVNTPTASTEEIFLNGILQDPGAGNDYTISTNTITYLAAPLTGDKLRVSYRY